MFCPHCLKALPETSLTETKPESLRCDSCKQEISAGDLDMQRKGPPEVPRNILTAGTGVEIYANSIYYRGILKEVTASEVLLRTDTRVISIPMNKIVSVKPLEKP